MERLTCNEPVPNTTLLILANFFSENSNPSENSRSITPTSASTSTSAELGTQPNPLGPTSMPVTRYPTMGDWRSL